MRRRSFFPLICHASVAALLGCAFLVVSVPKIWAAFRTKSFGPIVPYQTTDNYMAGLLRVQNGSERLVRAFSALPRDRPAAVVVVAGDDESTFLGYLVSYFAWPRPVRTVEVTPATVTAQLASFDRASVSAIFFCGIDPLPATGRVIPIGLRLVMMPMVANPEPTGP